jgi:hypothetical protein
MRQVEHQHNSREQVEEYLRQALEVTDELAPPPELQAIVFAKAVDLISSKQVFYEQVNASPILRPQ